MKYKKSNALIVFALEQESQGSFDDHSLLYTGVGKVQASLALNEYIQKRSPEVVINLGTAGSNKHKRGSVVNVTSFVQRDMDVTPLGFEPFQTPFSSQEVMLSYGEIIPDLPQGSCGTGDNFSVNEAFGNGAYDVVDMEAYVLALICQKNNIPFICLKYISDGADGAADQDWDQALKSTSMALRNALDEHIRFI